ncbi:hypothetical protein MJG53_000867 [Ovis ammon polii x Ovis aries]|uniref:Uncharacterized protein n=1 Tax=Ovis ammon polii x Ovis aries TaxID=2918886 RepID=A0ACB9VJ02_9CETA|nr:hypothetical protein MJG53_000867 [Ovis ammon polii x Ovis aries]
MGIHSSSIFLLKIIILSHVEGKKMAYQKVSADQRAPGHSQYLDNDDLQATALDLEWDMEKELEEPGFDQFQLNSAENQNLENSETADLNLDPIQPATSPKGRFQRLQEESDYVTHYTRSAPKSNPCNFCRLLKIFCMAIILFISGILIGYYSHKNCPSNATSSGTLDLQLYQEILKTIQAEDIKKSFSSISNSHPINNLILSLKSYKYVLNLLLLIDMLFHYLVSDRNLVQLYKSEDDIEISKKIKTQWTSLGLEDVQLVNYSVLLNLPGLSPSSVTLSSSGQCFHPNGQACSEEARKWSSQDLLYSYAAYSANGILEAEVIDVSYGNADDLKRIKKMKNVTNRIALLKLGKLPLLYKLSLLEKTGFGGVLLYIDPCDLPKTANLSYNTFMVSLNPGGDPSTPGYPSIGQLLLAQLDRNYIFRVNIEEKIFEERIVNMKIQTVTKFETVTNVVGYLKGVTFPDRYVIVGSHHHTAHSYNRQEWASSTAIITAFVRALMLRVKKGWRPDRTIVFCSWGGTAFGNIGSYEWGEKNKFNCPRRDQCPKTNISSEQMQDDADYFINHLGVPTMRFTYEDIRALECYMLTIFFPDCVVSFKIKGPSFLSEALFPKHAIKVEEMDPFFNLHETIIKLSGEVILQIASEPVLPFNALDIALEVQNNLKGDQTSTPQLLALASHLRESAELFQSDEMRPANDPKERAPIRVRMLNDILQDMEKSFLVQHAPPGFYRNILYHLDGKTSQFSILLEAWEHCKSLASNETLQEALSEVLNSINAAQVYFKAGLDVFESVLVGKN